MIFGKLFRRKMLGNGEMNVFNGIVPFVRFLDKLMYNRAGLSIIVTATKK
jgi:hypothetical protein